MFDDRRRFLKTTVGAGVLGVGTILAAKFSSASEEESTTASSNGVVIGQSPKKEILYKKTENWDVYYKSAY